ncbi:integrase core domain-containing protein [Streptomyces polygonati]
MTGRRPRLEDPRRSPRRAPVIPPGIRCCDDRLNPSSTPASNSPPRHRDPPVGRRTGQRRDNALAEPFFTTIKRELLDTTTWPTRATARTSISDSIESRYNLHHPHSSHGDYQTAPPTRPPHQRRPSNQNKLTSSRGRTPDLECPPKRIKPSQRRPGHGPRSPSPLR